MFLCLTKFLKAFGFYAISIESVELIMDMISLYLSLLFTSLV